MHAHHHHPSTVRITTLPVLPLTVLHQPAEDAQRQHINNLQQRTGFY